MKSTASIVTKLALGLAIALSVTACKNSTETKTAATPAVAVDAKATIVYFNQDSLLKNYEYVKDMTKRLNDKGSSANADINSHQQAIQREYADYQKGASTMTADQRAQIEQGLQRKAEEFQQYRQNATAGVQQDQLSEQAKLYDKLAEFLKAYAKEKGYKMILTYQHGSASLMYGDPSLDVSAEIIKRLNEAYTKDKK